MFLVFKIMKYLLFIVLIFVGCESFEVPKGQFAGKTINSDDSRLIYKNSKKMPDGSYEVIYVNESEQEVVLKVVQP